VMARRLSAFAFIFEVLDTYAAGLLVRLVLAFAVLYWCEQLHHSSHPHLFLFFDNSLSLSRIVSSPPLLLEDLPNGLTLRLGLFLILAEEKHGGQAAKCGEADASKKQVLKPRHHY
jgi:hypothetical protein